MSETIYGLTATGLVRKRLAEVRREILDDLRDRSGLVWDETPDTVIGQLVAVFAEREAALWELAEFAYLSAYPASATGIPLDLAVSFSGVRRIQSSATLAGVVLYGTQGTLIPAGSPVDATVLPDGAARPPRFRLVDDVLITRDGAVNLQLRVPEAPAGSRFSITLAGVTTTVVSGVGETPDLLAGVLATIIRGSGTIRDALAVGPEVQIRADFPFAATWSDTLVLIAIGVPGTALAEVEGPITAPAGTITKVPEPVPGWSGVQNPRPAQAGTNRETDAELRRRYVLGVYRLGAATVPAIRANVLQDVLGVTSAVVFENVGDTTDVDGRPGHSVEAVVEGGADQDVADALFRLKAAGIASHGNVTMLVRDDTAHPHTIKFSRPELVPVWLRATLATTTEEAVPGDVAVRAAAAMVAEGAALQVGENVFLQRISAAVFRATSGVARVTLTAVRATPGLTPLAGAYTPGDVAIGPRERASFDVARVSVD